MGNGFFCMTKKDIRELGGSKNRSRSNVGRTSQRKMPAEEELLHRRALSMAIQQHQLSQRFEGGASMSRRHGSVSSRRLNPGGDSLANDKQQAVDLENFKTKKFVLVHGEGFGAWCWYKTIASLEEVGLLPIALDLVGSGIDQTDSNKVGTLADYSKPLINYLRDLPEDEKVILVGHGVEVQVSHMLWNIIQSRFLKQFFSVLLWSWMAKGLLMCSLSSKGLECWDCVLHFRCVTFLLCGSDAIKTCSSVRLKYF